MLISLVLQACAFFKEAENKNGSKASPGDVILIPEEVPFYAEPEIAGQYNSHPDTFQRFGRPITPEEELPSCFEILTLVEPSVDNPAFYSQTFTPADACLNNPDVAHSTDWNFECAYEVGHASPFIDGGATYGPVRIGTCAGLQCITHQMEEELKEACDPLGKSYDIYHCYNLKALNGGRGPRLDSEEL